MRSQQEMAISRLHVGSMFNFDGQNITPGANPSGAMDYFVDGNRARSGNGKSWGRAFKTLAEAIEASNDSIGAAYNRWWARRNRIFVCGDEEIEEDLTILPEKCDVIGVGYDIFPFPRVIGNHEIAATRPTAGKANGCRFINMGFWDKHGTKDVFAVPASCHGLSFIGCHFLPKAAGSAGKALEITSCANVRIVDCTFDVLAGNTTNIFALAISIEGLNIWDTRIVNNRITATLGIHVVEAAAVAHGSSIEDNYIRATGLPIDDDSDKFQIINNRWITDIDTSTSTAGYDFNLQLACGNIQMGATGLCDTVPFAKIAE